MVNLWLLTFSVTLFGIGNGLSGVAMPQKGLVLGFTSAQQGFVGTLIPLGYALGCFGLGKLLRSVTGKFVVCAGLLGAWLAFLMMAQADTVFTCALSSLLYGLCCGAFWPFSSAWCLDFQTEGIAKTRILRHYNVGWTSGTALGSFAGGQLCGLPLDKALDAVNLAFYAGAGVMACNLLLACAAKATRNSLDEPAAADGPVSLAQRVSLALLAAAVAANVLIIASRMSLGVTYPELNKLLGGDPERMGSLAAASIAGQMLAFLLGHMYEPYLGMRRLYVFMGASLIVLNLGFAFASSPPLLLACGVLLGVAAAVGFQTAILAAIGYFRLPRAGTVFHETVIGLAGVSPLASGFLVSSLKEQGWSAPAALQAPFVAVAVLAALALIFQLALISRRMESRKLLPRGMLPGEGA